MKKLKLAKIGQYCWRSLAVMLVVCALLISAVRSLLPQLDEYKIKISDYLLENYGVNVDVGKLSASWEAFGPEVMLSDLVLPSQTHIPLTVAVDNVNLKLDFWQSLVTLKPQLEDVIFNGVKITVDIDKLNTTKPSKPAISIDDPETNIDWLYTLLLEQFDYFLIADADVQLISAERDYRQIHIRDLRWRNNNQQHQGQGSIYLIDNASKSERLTLRLDIHGNGTEPSKLTGKAYVQAQSLDLGLWASRQPNPYNKKDTLPLEGIINLKAWASFGNGRIENGVLSMQPSWLMWSQGEQSQKIAVDTGMLSFAPTEKGWKLDSKFQFATNGTPWPELHMHAMKQGEELHASANLLPLDKLLPLLPLIPDMPLDGLKTWQKLQPQGELTQIKVYKNAAQPMQLHATLNQASWQNVDSIPGVKPININVGWDGHHLNANFPKQNYYLTLKKDFKEPLAFLASEFNVIFNVDTQALSVPQLAISNEDITINAALQLALADSPHLALSSHVEVHNAAFAKRYYPLRGMKPVVISYLEESIKQGKIENGAVVFNGNLSEFPYLNHSGIFQADFDIKDTIYKFQPDWPELTEATIYGLFENKSMDLLVKKGKLLNVNAKGARVTIPEMGPEAVLNVNSKLKVKAADAKAVLKQSSLKNSVGATLDIIQVEGTVSGKLDLDFPLHDNAEKRITGEIDLNNIPIYIAKPGIQLDNVKGNVKFIGHKITSDNLTAKLYEQPLQLKLKTHQEKDDFIIDSNITGQWNLAKLPQTFDNPLSPFYQGKAALNGTLNINLNSAGFKLNSNVTADLLKTDISLPAPFNKPASKPLKVTAVLNGNQDKSEIDIKFGQQAEFKTGFKTAKGLPLSYYNIIIGRLYRSEDKLIKKNGNVKIELDKTNIDNWLPVLSTLNKSDMVIAPIEVKNSEYKMLDDSIQPELPPIVESTSTGLLPPLNSLKININKLVAFNKQVTNLHIDALPKQHYWRINAKSSQLEGQVTLYPDWYNQGIKIVAKKLYIEPESDLSASEPVIEAANETMPEADLKAFLPTTFKIPQLAINVDDFKYHDMSFGHFVLQGGPVKTGYNIQTFSMTTDDSRLSGNGKWHNNADNKTEINMSLKGESFEKLVERLNINPGLKDAPTDISANLNWSGSPKDFKIASLNGHLRFDLGKGHIEEISDKGARIFSLFSMDSLLRKLSLDFSDVFGKGLYFEHFGGDLAIENGVLKTTNTEMDAIAGDMNVRGYTDLASQSLNYDIRFVPELASSVPTVVLVSTSAWSLGLGAFALTKALEPVIDVISEIRFKLTGSMSEPHIEEVERKSKEIEIPESVLSQSKNEIQQKQQK